MASNTGESSATSDVRSEPISTTLVEESRTQASPLPLKRGEIGFNEEVHGDSEANRAPDTEELALPVRHPADREPPIPSDNDSDTPATAPSVDLNPSTASINTTSTSIRSKRTVISFFIPKKIPSYKGIRLTTLIALAVLLLAVGGTIATWEISVKHLRNATTQKPADEGGGNRLSSAEVFIHVVFAVVLFSQLLFLDRWTFTLRAERYAYLHPGGVLPTSRQSSPNDTRMGFAPWNRPPLPTYAATLAASGYGTGDVEDHIIAAPAPPAYGNTRGSMLLLSGFLRDSLRAQRPRSERSDSERPKSYASRDDEWEEIRDAERAVKLEETLATLEDGTAQNGTAQGSDAHVLRS